MIVMQLLMFLAPRKARAPHGEVPLAHAAVQHGVHDYARVRRPGQVQSQLALLLLVLIVV
jgi:hypothetical protein